jgi:hypothetical protein
MVHTSSSSPLHGPKAAKPPGLNFRAHLTEGGDERVKFARTEKRKGAQRGPLCPELEARTTALWGVCRNPDVLKGRTATTFASSVRRSPQL